MSFHFLLRHLMENKKKLFFPAHRLPGSHAFFETNRLIFANAGARTANARRRCSFAGWRRARSRSGDGFDSSSSVRNGGGGKKRKERGEKSSLGSMQWKKWKSKNKKQRHESGDLFMVVSHVAWLLIFSGTWRSRFPGNCLTSFGSWEACFCMSARACAFECASAFAHTNACSSLQPRRGDRRRAARQQVEVGWGWGEVGRGTSRRHLIGWGGLMIDASEARAHAAVRTCRLCPTYWNHESI